MQSQRLLRLLVATAVSAVVVAFVPQHARRAAVAPRRHHAPSPLVMRDFPKPNVENTDPYREANALSSRFSSDLKVPAEKKKKVAIIGGGLSGLACAR